MHIALGPELTKQLTDYADPREETKTSILRLSLKQFFDTSYPEREKETAVRLAVGRHFSVPKVFPYQAFFLFLYKLSHQCPKTSSREFWGPVIYLSSTDRTNREVYEEIASEISRELQK